MMIRLAREFKMRVHIVHVSSVEGARAILRAWDERPPVTVSGETCPHYLTFAAEEIPAGATEFKCAPPIRESAQRDALWESLYNGLSMIATDHSPAPPSVKCPGDFMKAWGGVASLEMSLAAVWTGARARGFTEFDVAWWMTVVPATLARLIDRKGKIEVGYDADFVIWDPDTEWTVDAAQLQQRHKLTPYHGRTLRGRVVRTVRRGRTVWDGDRLAAPAAGQLL
jgi:allantoinase